MSAMKTRTLFVGLIVVGTPGTRKLSSTST